MSVVTFEEPKAVPRPQMRRGLVGWLIEKHIVETVSQASILLLVVTGVFFILAFFMLQRAVVVEPIDPMKHFVPAHTRP